MTSLKPIDWFCLIILIQIKTIHQSIQESQKENQNDTFYDYKTLQSLLVLSTQLIFKRHLFQLDSIADFQNFIQSNLNQINPLAFNQILRSINLSLLITFDGSADALYRFSVKLNTLVHPTSNSQLDRPTEFHPESPIGLYVRACRLDISTLEFDQISAMATRLKYFFEPTLPQQQPLPPYPNNPSSTIHPSFDLSDTDPILEAYLDFTDSYAPDFNKASNSLRRFYDIKSSKNRNHHHYSKTSNQIESSHQEALLSLSKLYLSMEAYPTALDALEEAARLARLASDRTILDQCASLRRRIMYFSEFETASKIEQHETTKEDESVGLTGPTQAQARLQSLRNLGHSHDGDENSDGRNRIQSKLDSVYKSEWSFWDFNEEIFSVFKSVHIGAEPLNHLHAKLFRANRMKIVDHNSEDSGDEKGRANHVIPFDQISWFALQAKIWDLQGQVGLCEIYEDLALEFHEGLNLQEENSIPGTLKLISTSDVICHRALRLATNGRFYEALVLICQLIIDNQADAKSFRFIQQIVFEIFQFKSKHEGNENLLSTLQILQSHTSNSQFVRRTTRSISGQKQIENLLDQAENFINQGNHHAALCPAVSAIIQSDRMNLKKHQSQGIILWANVILHLHRPSTEEGFISAEDDDNNKVGGSDTGNQIVQKLRQILDLPGLQFNSLLKIQLFWALVRHGIQDFFSSSSNTLHSDQFASLSKQFFDIFDLLTLIDIHCRKVEDSHGRKEALGYQLIIIEEIKIRLGLNINKPEQQEREREKAKEMFVQRVNEVEKDLQKSWVELCNKDKNDGQLEFDSTFFEGLQPSLKDLNFNDDAGCSNNHLFNLFVLIKNLMTICSVHRYL